jgi:hypothetical protein
MMTDEQFAQWYAAKLKEPKFQNKGKAFDPQTRTPELLVAKKPAKQNQPAVAEPQFDIERTMEAIAAAVGFQAPAAVIKKIEVLQFQRDKVYQYRESLAKFRFVTDDEVQSAGDALIEAATNGEELSGPAITLKKSVRRDEYTNHKKQANAALKTIVSEAAALARPVVEEFKAACSKHIAELISAEAAIAKQYHVRYSESQTITFLKRAITMLDKMVPANETLMFNNPSAFLPPFIKPSPKA